MVKKKKKRSKLKMPKLPFKKLGIVGLVITVMVIIFLFRDVIFCNYPYIVLHYRMKYNEMASVQYKNELFNYIEQDLNDSINGLNFIELIIWEHKYLSYPNTNRYRPELPIDILMEGEGSCGEFALLYNGLLLANGYRSRIVVDCSVSTDGRIAGDHVWNEVYINDTDTWIHVDPTEGYINNPDLYANPEKWNKCVNLIYAIEFSEITDVTETYR